MTNTPDNLNPAAPAPQPPPAHPAEEQLTALLLDELAPEQAAAVRGHLASCAACRELSRDLERTLALVREAFAAAPLAAPVSVAEVKTAAILPVAKPAPKSFAANVKRPAFRPAAGAARTKKKAWWQWSTERTTRSRVIEVFAVVAILAVLAGIMLPALSMSRESAHRMVLSLGEMGKMHEIVNDDVKIVNVQVKELREVKASASKAAGAADSWGEKAKGARGYLSDNGRGGVNGPVPADAMPVAEPIDKLGEIHDNVAVEGMADVKFSNDSPIRISGVYAGRSAAGRAAMMGGGGGKPSSPAVAACPPPAPLAAPTATTAPTSFSLEYASAAPAAKPAAKRPAGQPANREWTMAAKEEMKAVGSSHESYNKSGAGTLTLGSGAVTVTSGVGGGGGGGQGGADAGYGIVANGGSTVVSGGTLSLGGNVNGTDMNGNGIAHGMANGAVAGDAIVMTEALGRENNRRVARDDVSLKWDQAGKEQGAAMGDLESDSASSTRTRVTETRMKRGAELAKNLDDTSVADTPASAPPGPSSPSGPSRPSSGLLVRLNEEQRKLATLQDRYNDSDGRVAATPAKPSRGTLVAMKPASQGAAGPGSARLGVDGEERSVSFGTAGLSASSDKKKAAQGDRDGDAGGTAYFSQLPQSQTQALAAAEPVAMAAQQKELQDVREDVATDRMQALYKQSDAPARPQRRLAAAQQKVALKSLQKAGEDYAGALPEEQAQMAAQDVQVQQAELQAVDGVVIKGTPRFGGANTYTGGMVLFKDTRGPVGGESAEGEKLQEAAAERNLPVSELRNQLAARQQNAQMMYEQSAAQAPMMAKAERVVELAQDEAKADAKVDAPMELAEAKAELKQVDQLEKVEKKLEEVADVALAQAAAEPEQEAERTVQAFVTAAANAFSTFAIDVDTASYTRARRELLEGRKPSPGAIRAEEFINSFDYDYAPPPAGRMFSIQAEAAPSPFRPSLELLKLGIKGYRLARDAKSAAVVTFVIDGSGSMDTADRMGLVKQAIRFAVARLQPEDRVAIVRFSNQASLVLEPTPAGQSDAILAAVNDLQCGGSTNLEAGLRLGYATAIDAFVPGGANRVILLSDGVANLGAADATSILAAVEKAREMGIYISVFGVGAGTYNDKMLETLADKGDGQYAYLDSADTARAALGDNLDANLFTIAKDVKIQVEFNPLLVKRWRQIGYDNRQLTKEQFRNDTVDAGEVGLGQSVTALYELELDPAAGEKEPVGVVRVRYRDVKTGRVEEVQRTLSAQDRYAEFAKAPARFRLAAGVAEFAERLRGSPFVDGGSYDEVLQVLRPVALELRLDRNVQELPRLVRAAER